MRISLFLALAGVAFAQGAGPSSDYTARREKAVAAATVEFNALGKWARQQKLFASARRAYQAAAVLSPQDEEAKTWLELLDPQAPVGEPADLKEKFAKQLKEIGVRHSRAFSDLAAWATKSKLETEAGDAADLARRLDTPAISGLRDDEKTILEDVNRHRLAAALVLAKIDRKMSDAAKKHADYLVLNAGDSSTSGLGAHNEHAKFPGYTAEGERAGKSSDIIYQPVKGSVDGWMATLYHRIPILHPRLRRVGCGYSPGGKTAWVGVLNLIEGYENVTCKPEFVRYPARGQRGVTLEFLGEVPDPVPGGFKGAGYPVTLTFYDGSTIAGATATLRVQGSDEVPCHFSSPEKPATDFAQQGTLCLIPKTILSGGTTYEAEFRCQRNGEAFLEKWTFETK